MEGKKKIDIGVTKWYFWVLVIIYGVFMPPYDRIFIVEHIGHFIGSFLIILFLFVLIWIVRIIKHVIFDKK